MGDFERIKKLYEEIRNCDNKVDQLITDGKVRMQEKGPNVIYRDMGLSNDIVHSFTPSDGLVAWFTELNAQSDCQSDQSSSGDETQEKHADDDSDWTDVTSNEEFENVDSDYTNAIPEEEVTLAKKFRKCCDAFGREIRRYLPQTARYLLEYGRIYLRYATDNGREDADAKIDQKLNFLRATALVNAAIVRYAALEQQQDHELAIQQLRALHCRLLEESVSKMKNIDFVEFSHEVKRRFTKLRMDEINSLSYITILRKRSVEINEAQEEYEREIISKIRGINASNSKQYSNIMADVIKHCLEVMGEPPCKFVIAGLGSLAREEITLSSDFEHVIILEDGTPVTEKVREYFRWFTVIFHVVVIGLGETVVPSIDVKSLSDQYSADVSEKWYKDEYTPCGISFDGMMPHACKCPLGRQKPTRNRENIIELIQTASAMASFLTVDQDVENGYMLQDVLRTTVYVYGDHDVYESFLAKCDEIKMSLTSVEIFLGQREMMHRVTIAWDVTYNIAATYMNIKNTLYRPLTVMLHCLASVLRLPCNSSFDIITELLKKNFINEECHHIISHALSVVLELRMRCYLTKHRQRNIILDRNIPKLVREECILDFRVTVIFLFDAMTDFYYGLFRLNKPNPVLLLPPRRGDYWQCFAEKESIHFRKNDEKYIEEMLERIKRLVTEHEPIGRAIGRSYYFLKRYVEFLSYTLRRFTKNNAYQSHDYGLLAHHELREIYFWSREKLILFESNVSERVRSLVEEAYMLYHDKEYKKAEKRLDESVAICKENEIYDEDILDDLAVLEYDLKTAVLEPDVAINYFLLRSAEQETYHRECVIKLGIARALFKKGNEVEGKQFVDNLVDELKANSLKMTQFHYSGIMFAAGDILLKFGNRDEGYLLQEEGNRPRDAKFAGEYPDNTDIFANLQLSTHYKYNFGTRGNVGKHSNFTYNSIHYELTLPLKMLFVRYWNALLILSSETYSDMIILIEYALDDMKFDYNLPEKHLDMWKHTQAIAFMTLCENVKFRDLELFGKLLGLMSVSMRMFKVLQPFIYACLGEYIAHPKADCNLPTSQNAILRHSFFISQDIYQNKALVNFTNFKYINCIRILWMRLHLNKEIKKSDFRTILEFFLTSVLTVMIARKRKSPLPHLRRCRELSVKQAMWMEYSSLDENHRQSMSSRLFMLSEFYKYSDEPYSLLFNLALDFVAYDERGASSLLWKLIHARNLNTNLLNSSILLLLDVVDKLCRVTLEFSYHHRQR